MFTITQQTVREGLKLLLSSAIPALLLINGCSDQNPVWPGPELKDEKNVIMDTLSSEIKSARSSGCNELTLGESGKRNLTPSQVLKIPDMETNANAIRMNGTGSVTEGGEVLQVMIRDIGGNILSQPLRHVDVSLTVKCYIDIYWSPVDGRMKNILAPMIPSSPAELFGHSSRIQSKWWPLVSEYKMLFMPDDFISWVYVELRDVASGTAYCLPGYLDRGGNLKDVSGAMFKMSVAQDNSYSLILHTFNGITVVAADGGISVKNFSVTKGTVIEWNFTEEWTRALIHSSCLSYPMIELQGQDYTTVWAIASGDVPSNFSPGAQVTWDNMIDLSDINSIEQNFGPNPGFSVYEMDQDKKIDRSDLEYVSGNTILCISGNPYSYSSAVK